MTVLSGSSAGKMMRNEVMMAARLMGPCPLAVGPPGSFGAAAHFVTAAEGLTQASQPPGTGSTPAVGTVSTSRADRDCRRPGDGATPLRSFYFTQRHPELTMSGAPHGWDGIARCD